MLCFYEDTLYIIVRCRSNIPFLQASYASAAEKNVGILLPGKVPSRYLFLSSHDFNINFEVFADFGAKGKYIMC